MKRRLQRLMGHSVQPERPTCIYCNQPMDNIPDWVKVIETDVAHPVCYYQHRVEELERENAQLKHSLMGTPQRPCDMCRGSGYTDEYNLVRCELCEGSGYEQVMNNAGDMLNLIDEMLMILRSVDGVRNSSAENHVLRGLLELTNSIPLNVLRNLGNISSEVSDERTEESD